MDELLNRVLDQIVALRINAAKVALNGSPKNFVEAGRRLRTIRELLAQFRNELKKEKDGKIT